MLEIDAAVPQHWIQAVTDPQPESQPFLTGWWAFFTTLDSRPSWARHGDSFFVVLPDYRLLHADSTSPLTSGTWHRIRVVGSKGKVHKVDPDFEMEEIALWTFWIWEGRPLSQLSWDPGEWLWPAAHPSEPAVSFFDYSVPIGRSIFLRQEYMQPTRLRFWLHAGLSHAFTGRFWSYIWSARISRRISYFMWMIAHAGLAVGTWSAQMGHDASCIRCISHLPESQRHCLWACVQVQPIWRCISLLLSRVGVCQGFVTWGAVSWLLQFSGPHLFFEGEPSDPVFLLGIGTYYRGTLSMIHPSVRDTADQDREPIFATIASITLWCIWKARCMHVLSHEPSTSLETLRIIWSELLHTLRSQWDASQGDSRAAQQRRFDFLRTWGRSAEFFHLSSGFMVWHYAMPEWLILHASHQPP